MAIGICPVKPVGIKKILSSDMNFTSTFISYKTDYGRDIAMPLMNFCNKSGDLLFLNAKL